MAYLSSSLRSRLLAFFIAHTALPVLIIGVLAYGNARQTIEDRVIAHLTSVADLKEEQIHDWLNQTGSDARLLAVNFLNQEHFTVIMDPGADPALQEAFSGFLVDNLVSLQQVREGYQEIFFVDMNGEIVLTTNPANTGRNMFEHEAVAGTLASPTGEFIQDIHRTEDSGEIEMAFGHLILGVDLKTAEVLETPIGAIIMRVQMDQAMYPLIQAWPGMGDTGETLLARSEADRTLFLNPLRFNEGAPLEFSIHKSSDDAKPAHNAVAGLEGIIETTDYRGVPVLAAYRHIDGIGWGFVAKQDLAEAYQAVGIHARQWILISSLGLLAASISAILLSHALTTPLLRLVEATRSVAEGNYDVTVHVTSDDEIGKLADSFRRMIAAIGASHLELETHSEELGGLLKLSSSLLATLDQDDTLSRALEQMMRATNMDAAAALIADHTTDEIVIRAVQGFPDYFVGERFPVDSDTAPGHAIYTGTPTHSPDLTTETRFQIPDFVRALGYQSNLAVPMLVGDRAIGAIVIDSFQKRSFSDHDIRFAQAIANQTALALERVDYFEHLSASYDRTLDALVVALDARDNETEGHSRRVVAYTMALAEKLALPERACHTLRRGALLHDIGKIAIPDAILHKPGPLDDDEWEIMRFHPVWGQKILKGITFLSGPAEIVGTHHERWDGTGYPDGLAGEQIPLGARIFAVADALDAITSDRPYRVARSFPVARSEILRGKGTQFDPRVVEAFAALSENDWRNLRNDVESVRSKMTELLGRWPSPNLAEPVSSTSPK